MPNHISTIKLSEAQRARIRREMTRRRLTHTQLADMAGLHRANLTLMLAGERQASADTWRRVTEPLGLDLRLSVILSRRP